MKNKLFGVFLFVAGAAVGSVATWKFVKTKYERIAQEEINSVKETFSEVNGSAEDSAQEDSNKDCSSSRSRVFDIGHPPLEDPDEDPQDHMKRLFEYESTVQRLKYGSVKTNREEGDEPVVCTPYVISPDMYGEDGYDTSALTYYADGILEDDYWNIIDNVEEVVGTDFKNHFGEYADETVFIRNEELKTDYEITRDKRTQAESQMYSPHGVEDNA